MVSLSPSLRPAGAVLCALAVAAAGLSVPRLARAQEFRTYGTDPCREAKRGAGNKGALAGGAAGALLGTAAAGGGVGSHLTGALIGGAAGAVAGHLIGRSTVQCAAYPARFRQHAANCRWVDERWRGRRHSFEVCRDSDGEWRPSGRV